MPLAYFHVPQDLIVVVLRRKVCALALSNDLLPGGANTATVDTDIPLAYLLKSRPGRLRHALSNSFGFGGSNCSLILGVAR